jgi:hypothetical protein
MELFPRPTEHRAEVVAHWAQRVVDGWEHYAATNDPQRLEEAIEGLRLVLPDALPLSDRTNPRRYLEGQPFRGASTVPDAPHEYLLLSRATDPVRHLRLIDLIRRTGEPGRFRNATYAYRLWGNWVYWASPPVNWGRNPPILDSILNRRRAEE